MVTDVPSEVRGPVDDEAARRYVISPEITSTSLRKVANEHCTPENQRQKNNLCEAVFCFHGDSLTIELAFRQQVASGAVKNLLKVAPEVATIALASDLL